MPKISTSRIFNQLQIKLLLVVIFYLSSGSILLAQLVPALNGEPMLETEIHLEFQNAQWLDSANYCFLSLTLFEERTAPEEISIGEIQLFLDQYTEVISGMKLIFNNKTLEPLIYHQYADSLGDYKQALFLCDDFDAQATDSLEVEISSIAGHPRQSQAFFYHYQQSVIMPEESNLCNEARATEKWFKAWLKKHPEFHDYVVRR
jgi:hypothetical protein